MFASDDEAVAELDERRRDPEIHDLARKGISLDIFQRLSELGGPESALKARGALIAFDSALRQSREQAACILFVAAAECLANPRTEWKRERLTKRFIDLFRRLMPEDLDEIVNHRNFEDAFGIRRGSAHHPRCSGISCRGSMTCDPSRCTRGSDRAYPGSDHLTDLSKRGLGGLWSLISPKWQYSGSSKLREAVS